MLELIDLMAFEVIVASKLGFASFHGVGGFQQVVTEVTATRHYYSVVLCQEKVQIKYALLMLSYPAKASALSSNAA